MNNRLELGRISLDALYICTRKMNIPVVGKSLDDQNWHRCKEAEDQQKERRGNGADLDTDHVFRQNTSGLGS